MKHRVRWLLAAVLTVAATLWPAAAASAYAFRSSHCVGVICGSASADYYFGYANLGFKGQFSGHKPCSALEKLSGPDSFVGVRVWYGDGQSRYVPAASDFPRVTCDGQAVKAWNWISPYRSVAGALYFRVVICDDARPGSPYATCGEGNRVGG